MSKANFHSHSILDSKPNFSVLAAGTHIHQLSGLPCAQGQVLYPNQPLTCGVRDRERRQPVRKKAAIREREAEGKQNQYKRTL